MEPRRAKVHDRTLPSASLPTCDLHKDSSSWLGCLSRNATSNHRLLQTAAKAASRFEDSGLDVIPWQVLAKSHPESSQSSLLGQLEKAFQQEFGHDSHGETPDDRSCPDAYLMRTPFKARSQEVPCS